MLSAIKKIIAKERGASAVEYGLASALIAVFIIGGTTLLGTNLESKFNEVASEVGSAKAGNGSGAFANTSAGVSAGSSAKALASASK